MAIPFTVVSGAILITDPSGDVVAIETKSNGTKSISATSEIGGSDSLGAYRKVGTKVRTDGLIALVTDATVVVESTFGFDQNPDSYFKVLNTGSEGTTWTIFVDGTNNDPSTPDRDLPSFTKIFTVLLAEVGDELKFRDRMVQELNQDTIFKDTVFLKAQRVTDRATVHIYSKKFSASGEFYERPLAGAFNVTVSGDGVPFIGFDNLISRSKPVTIATDIESPHRLGLFGITGSVSVTAGSLSDLYIQEVTADGTPTGSTDLRVNATLANPQEFFIATVIEKDLFVEMLMFDSQANGIKFGNFLGQNSPLGDPILVEIKSDDTITQFPPIYTTEDFKNVFAALSGTGGNFHLDVQPGADEMVSILKFDNPFIIRATGTFSIDDYVKVTIQDNTLQGISRLKFRVKGFEKES